MTVTSPRARAPRIRDAEPLDRSAVVAENASPPPPAPEPDSVWPGLALTVAIAATGVAMVRLPGLAAVSPMIVAMLIGIGLRNTIGARAWAQPGIAFSARRVLRLAIVLLGLQLTLTQLVAVGGRGIGIIVATLLASFAFATWAGRRLGVDRRLTQLIAAGTSICGASAVIATNSVTAAPDEDVSYAVACVTVFGSLAMLIYPWLPAALGLDPQDYGLWAGASIHEVAQVVVAGFQDGQVAGEFATISKLARVMMLAPLVLLLGVLARAGAAAGETAAARPPMPWFVLGFVAMVALGSVVELPAQWKQSLATLTAFLLSIALAAMGLDTELRRLAAEGLRPALLGALASLFIAGFSLALIKLTG